MRKAIYFILFVLIPKGIGAQSFSVDTILFNGDPEKHINIVILGDGYVESELGKFSEDAVLIKDALFNVVPYSKYQNFFNVFAIPTPSNESGASHPGTASDVNEPAHPVKAVDNYYGSTFDAFGIHRLVVPNKSSVIFGVLANNFPLYDQVLVIVNTSFYGGSGGTYATTTLAPSASEIAIHEIGHSFSNLIDEYYAGDQYSREGINMTAETDPSKVKWKNWMGFSGVGIYQHCCGGDSGKWYRPHENCKMRVLGPDFCPVCIEGTVERIHTLVPSIIDFSPELNDLTSETFPIPLRVDYNKPEPNSIVTSWKINSVSIENASDSLLLSEEMLETGFNEILFSLEDQSELLRVDGHADLHTEFVLWEFNNEVTSLDDITITQEKLNVNIYPNPGQEVLHIENRKQLQGPINVNLMDMDGKLLMKDIIYNVETITLDISELPQGTYFLDFRKSSSLVASSKIIKL